VDTTLSVHHRHHSPFLAEWRPVRCIAGSFINRSHEVQSSRFCFYFNVPAAWYWWMYCYAGLFT